MKIRTPVYLVYSLLLCVYVALAGWRGWVLVDTLTPRFLRPSGPSGLAHK